MATCAGQLRGCLAGALGGKMLVGGLNVFLVFPVAPPEKVRFFLISLSCFYFQTDPYDTWASMELKTLLGIGWC